MTAPSAVAAPSSALPRQRRAQLSASTIAFALFALVTIGGLAAVGGVLFSLLYIAFAALAGFVAYYRKPGRYVSFVFLLWWFTPFVRRVIDYRHGFNPTNLVLVAPTVVTLISFLTIVYRARELRGKMLAPFVLTLVGVGYAYFIGLLKVGLVPATYALLTWLAPISLAAHLALSWRDFPVLRDSFRSLITWALPVVALYGIVQQVWLPPWDKYWMLSAQVASIGVARPFGFRAFGTLNTPGPYSVVLLVGMLYLLSTAKRSSMITLSLAFVAMLLTRTRSAWIALVIGVFVVQFMGPIRRIARNWLMLGAMLLLAAPVLSLDAFRGSIMARVASFASLEEDNSVQARLGQSWASAAEIVATAEGQGLGYTGGATKLGGSDRQASIDNGFLEVFYVLGWPGGLLLMLGLLGQIITLFRFRDSRRDAFANASRAVFWAMLSVLIIGDIFSGSVGAMFWGAYGFACCAHAYNFSSGVTLRSQLLAREFQPASAYGAS